MNPPHISSYIVFSSYQSFPRLLQFQIGVARLRQTSRYDGFVPCGRSSIWTGCWKLMPNIRMRSVAAGYAQLGEALLLIIENFDAFFHKVRIVLRVVFLLFLGQVPHETPLFRLHGRRQNPRKERDEKAEEDFLEEGLHLVVLRITVPVAAVFLQIRILLFNFYCSAVGLLKDSNVC